MIQLKHIRKTYGNQGIGLNDESLIINNGEIVGVLGENGSGKTTLLKTIMGLCEVQAGEVLVDGRSVSEQYEKMAFITEEGSYFPYMTPYEYGIFLSDFIPAFDMERYIRLIKFFELEPYRKIKTFSKGQKSKLEVSAGFSKGAKYILMDEPFLGKDMFTRKDFLKLMITSLKSDETILIATHLIDEVENFLDRAIILRYGRIKADFYIDDIREEGENLASIMMDITGYKEDRFKEI
ncbi:ABC transporter ATP-binding protein [Xylanivirga thermophila]|uniref:ABC transporter ATP-binding protein n=1 Tax=Xylanivirga thermophila TaxID=2496273 RepID=UPI00101CDF8C|nr:ABC transporter ATP-binding protein [Xylanivirga thermophila]